MGLCNFPLFSPLNVMSLCFNLHYSFGPKAIAEIMAHWSWEWDQFTISVIDCLSEGLNLVSFPYFLPSSCLAKTF